MFKIKNISLDWQEAIFLSDHFFYRLFIKSAFEFWIPNSQLTSLWQRLSIVFACVSTQKCPSVGTVIWRCDWTHRLLLSLHRRPSALKAHVSLGTDQSGDLLDTVQPLYSLCDASPKKNTYTHTHPRGDPVGIAPCQQYRQPVLRIVSSELWLVPKKPEVGRCRWPMTAAVCNLSCVQSRAAAEIWLCSRRALTGRQLARWWEGTACVWSLLCRHSD